MLAYWVKVFSRVLELGNSEDLHGDDLGVPGKVHIVRFHNVAIVWFRDTKLCVNRIGVK